MTAFYASQKLLILLRLPFIYSFLATSNVKATITEAFQRSNLKQNTIIKVPQSSTELLCGKAWQKSPNSVFTQIRLYQEQILQEIWKLLLTDSNYNS